MNKKPACKDLEQRIKALEEAVHEADRVQDALRESEEKFRALADSTPTAVMLYQDDRWIFVNRAAETISGYPAKELLAMHFWDIIHPGYRALVKERGRKRQRGEEAPNRYEAKIITKDGTEKWVDLAGSSTMIGGRPAAVISVVDITEHKQAMEALEASEERFRTLFESAVEGVYHTTLDGRLVNLNMAFARMLGYGSPQEAIENVTNTANHIYANPDDRTKLIDLLTRKGLLNNYECLMRRRDGTVFWAVINARLDHQREGIPCIQGFIADITKRKLAEEALKESEQRFFIASLTTTDAIWDWDIAEGKLEWFGDIDMMLGCMAREFPRTLDAWVNAIHPDDRDRVMAAVDRHLHTQVPYDEEYRVVQKNGSIRYWTDRGIALHDNDGNAFRMIGSCTDITERKHAEEELRKFYDELELRVKERTVQLSEAYESLRREMEERKRAEEQLRQAQKMEAIGTLAGGIAHDFNNILAGIIGFAELVKDNTDPGSPEHRRLELVLKGAQRGRGLVKQILTFSRQSEHEQKPVALSNIVEEGLKLLRPLVPATAQIRSKTLPGGDTVLADPAQMHQVLINLCTNGVQAMGKKGGVLEIGVTRDRFKKGSHMPVPGMKPGDYITLRVRDTGCGMKPEVIERIFDPFFTTKAPGEGTGLGLSVVHGIVKSHRGFLTVESEPGKGSLFSVHLPRTERREAAADQEPAVRGGSECILFIDDEDMLVQLNHERLTQLGYDVVGTTRCAEALEIFKKEPGRFHLVITDYTMPDMTGADLAKKLLKIRSDIPVILFTGHNDDISAEKARKLGIREFLLKPQTKSELDRTIRRILDANTGQ